MASIFVNIESNRLFIANHDSTPASKEILITDKEDTN